MTKRYLQRSADGNFFLFFLGIPVLIWYYSIVVELAERTPVDKRLSVNFYRIILGLLVTCYFLIFTGTVDVFNSVWLEPAMFLLIGGLMVYPAITISRFEESNSIKPESVLLLLVYLWIAPFGVFKVQPLLNDYVLYPIEKGDEG